MRLSEHDTDNHSITVIPEHMDDLYTLYNLIMIGDRVSSKTSRRIKRDEGGSDTGKRTQVFMIIKTEQTEFHGFGDIIRVRGKIVEASDSNITIGSYHTIKIELFKSIIIQKKQPWSDYDLKNIEGAIVGQTTGIVIVALDDQSATIARVGSHATKIILEIDPSIPRKSGDVKQHQMGMNEFFKTLSNFLLEKVSEHIADQIIIGGPGFTREEYLDYCKLNYPKLIPKIQFTATQSAGRPGIRELVLHHLPEHLEEAKEASLQANLIKSFFDELGMNTGKVAYSKQVYQAAEMGAVETLLVLDKLMRGSVDQRNKIIDLINLVNENRGRVKIISTMQESSELLENFGGIVALLRFKTNFN